VLVFSAVKVATDWRHISPGVSVVGIALMILTAVAASLWRRRVIGTHSADSILWTRRHVLRVLKGESNPLSCTPLAIP
jgi:hypothetical protein